MRNADMPAMAQSFTRDSRGRLVASMALEGCGGLTKREYLAAMALPRIDVHIDDEDLRDIARQAAKMAVETADALLAELEKTQ